jgi:hypothetical protein
MPSNNVTPIGVILFYHGQSERSTTDLTLVEKNPLPAYLKVDGVRDGIEIPFIVIAPQEEPSQAWWGKALDGVRIAQSFNLPIHKCGLSLGSMVDAEIINNFGTVPFASLATVCGKINEVTFPNTIAELKKIPTIHYYDPSDKTIAEGYTSVKSVYTKLKALGADTTMVEYTGEGHEVWDKAYDGNAANGYTKWLMSKFAATPPPVDIKDPIVEIYLLNGKLTYRSASGLIFN